MGSRRRFRNVVRVTDPGTRAPSLVLYHSDPDDVPADILLQDVFVPAPGCTRYTYYCCMSWNVGQQGGGYCGIQDHPRGKNIIFSLWDPISSKEPINPVNKGPATGTARFHGEGTGLKSINFVVGWQPDHWYTLVTRRWGHHGHTRFGFWIHDLTNQKWDFLVSMDFPEPDVFFHKTSSFMEDWIGTGHRMRCVKFKDTWKRGKDGSWRPILDARFFVNQSEKTRLYTDRYNAQAKNGCYYMMSGHKTIPELGTSVLLTCRSSRASDTNGPGRLPTKPPITFSINSLSKSQITWHVAKSETPQFKYTVSSGKKILASNVNSDTRQCKVDLSKVSNVTLILEDILGRDAQISADITSKCV